MNEQPEVPQQISPTPPPRIGFAIASLVLGLLALVLSLFVVGSVLGIVGLILGVAHLRRRAGSRAMARWGIGLSLVGIVAAAGFGAMYHRAYKKYSAMMQSAGSDLT